MKQVLKLAIIGLFAGVVLIVVLRIVLSLTGNTAYVLLFNFDYIPIVKDLRPTWFFGSVFHFATCIVSVIALYHILSIWNLQKRVVLYILVNTIGGGALFFLTALSNQPPAANDWMAWIYWTLAHGTYSFVVGVLIKKWM